ncbi:stalk domain-containing protein [Paenibacillus sp. N1-5-1-14]|uniref:stalk domain-containing protein n=1 Tax=Paenibacillus radicibacter TaxID=2972488 RepID=UPI0021593F34|nr:stalk domain-containing protein [Paenibacillus radicibacter]MCR8641781.1 stalk domain-containing protein [Paenibacillus radicibacter]
MTLVFKKISTYAIAFMLVFVSLLGGTAEARTEKAPIVIDQQLDKIIRKEIYKPTGTLVKADLLKLKVLQIPEQAKVVSLEGLQYATNLRALIVEGNQITSLEPLTNLIKLSSVVLDRNQILDITPLTGLKNLQYVWLDHNQVSDLSPIASHKQIAELSVSGNPLNEASLQIVKGFEEQGVIVKNEQVDPESETSGEGQAEKPWSVYFGNSLIYSGAVPEMRKSVMMVPLRPLAEALHMTMDWDEEKQVIKVARERIKIELQIDNPKATVQGKEVTLLQAPRLVDGDTFIPLQLITDATEHEISVNEELQEVDIRSGFRSYVNEMLHSYFLKYEGATKDGKPHGKGKYMWEDNKVWYEGDFVEGKMQGSGTMHDVYNPDAYYIGAFKNGLPDGDGKYVHADGGYDVAHYINGKQEGLVKSYNAKGVLVFEGQYKDDVTDGQGTYYAADGFKFVGNYKSDGSLTGEAKIYRKDELIYEGNFADHFRNGKGKQYVDGKVEYEGDFYRDVPYGWGASYDERGKKQYEGEVVNSYFIGQGTSYMSNGDVYTGEHYMGQPDGYGVLNNAAGKVLSEGQFLAGRYDPTPEQTKQTEAYAIQSLQKKLDYGVSSGNEDKDEDELESDSKPVNMYLEFADEQDFSKFKTLSEAGKRKLITSFVQDHWQELTDVKDCLVVLKFDELTYVSAIVSEHADAAAVQFQYFPSGH